MFDDGGVVIEHLIFVGLCAPGCGQAFYGEQIFCGIWNAVQRAAIVSALDFFFGGVGFGKRNFGSEAGVGVELGPEFFGAVEIGFGEVHGRERFGLNALCKFAGGQKEDFIVEHGRVLRACPS